MYDGCSFCLAPTFVHGVVLLIVKEASGEGNILIHSLACSAALESPQHKYLCSQLHIENHVHEILFRYRWGPLSETNGSI